MCWPRGIFLQISGRLPKTVQLIPPLRPPMFNGSSNIIIHGGTFIVINGDIYQAHSASQSTVGVENPNCRWLDHIGRVPDTEPATYPTVGCHSTSVDARGQCLEHGPCLMPMPTFSSEGSSSPTPMFVDASRRNTTPKNDSNPSISNARLFFKTTIRHARRMFSFSRA